VAAGLAHLGFSHFLCPFRIDVISMMSTAMEPNSCFQAAMRAGAVYALLFGVGDEVQTPDWAQQWLLLEGRQVEKWG
jgi:hypothetical protein